VQSRAENKEVLSLSSEQQVQRREKKSGSWHVQQQAESREKERKR
jgi:hypothetical protein